MKKFLLGILTGLILAVLTGIVFIFSAMRLGERRPTVPDGATLVLRLNDNVPEKQPVSIPLPFIGSPDTTTVLEAWEGLRSAATDSRVKAVILETGRASLSSQSCEVPTHETISSRPRRTAFTCRLRTCSM
jgi:hypothetical protein